MRDDAIRKARDMIAAGAEIVCFVPGRGAVIRDHAGELSITRDDVIYRAVLPDKSASHPQPRTTETDT